MGESNHKDCVKENYPDLSLSRDQRIQMEELKRKEARNQSRLEGSP